MVSLAPSQSSRLVSCFALTQSVSLDLGPSKLEQTFVVSAQVFKTTGTASFTGVSRKSCTRSTFHLLPYSEFALHMCFRSERPSVGCSGSELRSDKDQNSAIKNTSGHRSASSLSYKQGSVSLLGGCSTPNIPNIIAFSPPSCATVLHPDNEVLLSFATHTLVYKLRPDVLRSSSASHPPARLVVNGPNFNCLWAWPSTTKEGSGPLLSQSIPTAYESQLTTAVCTGPEGAIETTSVSLVGEGWLSTSQHKVTKSQLSDRVLHASSTHSSFVLNSLSSSDEELSCLINLNCCCSLCLFFKRMFNSLLLL
ncbi:uncharacterized protein LOC117128469 [Brassica rapa]|uniref:uncharacterized protein LOC117128469 n=1 Tax=Brassica campestris TaxID=3711 RepID=UPI00142D3A91|nr:uncharacterized protein LOC117128469 [Brassica rapa]